MSRLHASFVLGYHGCDAAVAERIVSGRAPMRQSDRLYDWLGSGIYFWEADPQRALEWAGEKVARGAYRQAAVVGAVIDLGECLNLLSRDGVELLKQAYTEFANEIELTNETMPENGSLGVIPMTTACCAGSTAR